MEIGRERQPGPSAKASNRSVVGMKQIAKLLLAGILLAGSAAVAEEQTFINYRVKSGDTLSAIASKYLNNPKLYKELLKYNDIKDANWIYPGDVIKIPSSEVLQKMADAKDDEAATKVAQEDKQKQSSLKFSFRSSSGTNGGTDIYATATGDAAQTDASPLKLSEIKQRLKSAPIDDVTRYSVGGGAVVPGQ